MFKYKLIYSNGTEQIKTFKTKEEASWYINNEGDHLISVIPL